MRNNISTTVQIAAARHCKQGYDGHAQRLYVRLLELRVVVHHMRVAKGRQRLLTFLE